MIHLKLALNLQKHLLIKNDRRLFRGSKKVAKNFRFTTTLPRTNSKLFRQKEKYLQER